MNMEDLVFEAREERQRTIDHIQALLASATVEAEKAERNILRDGGRQIAATRARTEILREILIWLGVDVMDTLTDAEKKRINDALKGFGF